MRLYGPTLLLVGLAQLTRGCWLEELPSLAASATHVVEAKLQAGLGAANSVELEVLCVLQGSLSRAKTILVAEPELRQLCDGPLLQQQDYIFFLGPMQGGVYPIASQARRAAVPASPEARAALTGYADCAAHEAPRAIDAKAAARKLLQAVSGTTPDCISEPARGSCTSSLQRFYYDTTTLVCQPFVYGGCSGNGNNYATLAACNAACTPPTGGSGAAEAGGVKVCTALCVRGKVCMNGACVADPSAVGDAPLPAALQMTTGPVRACSPPCAQGMTCRTGQCVANTPSAVTGPGLVTNPTPQGNPPAGAPGAVCRVACVRGKQCVNGVCVTAGAGNAPPVCACPLIYLPVCGADGETYASSCEATCANVAIVLNGPCLDSGDFNGTDSVGAAMAPVYSSCDFCTQNFDPVCGVDGITYSNECIARCAGTSIRRTGSC